MSILVRLCCLLVLLSFTACIGSSVNSPHWYGDKDARQHGTTELDAAFNHDLIGMTSDQLIIKYGPTSRSATLDSGYKLMHYNSKPTWITEAGNRHYTNCELRFWMRDKTVHHVDYLGDQTVCANFILTSRKSFIDDERPLK